MQHKQVIGDKQTTGPFGSIEIPSYKVTSQGMKCRFPIAEVDGITIAVLLANAREDHFGLLLHPASSTEVQDPGCATYYISWAFQLGQSFSIRCVASLGPDLYNLRFRGKPVHATWRNILIRSQPRISERADGAHLVLRFSPDLAPTPFRVPRHLLHTLCALKFIPEASNTAEKTDTTTGQATHITFADAIASEAIGVTLGICTPTPAETTPRHWARAERRYLSTWTQPWAKDVAHDCAQDHVDDWPERTREFGDSARTIRLSFAPCPHAPERARVLGLELSGSVYEKIQQNAGVSLSARTRLGGVGSRGGASDGNSSTVVSSGSGAKNVEDGDAPDRVAESPQRQEGPRPHLGVLVGAPIVSSAIVAGFVSLMLSHAFVSAQSQ